jgi:hypothetical protein
MRQAAPDDQWFVGLQAERLAQLGRQRDDAATGDGDGGLHCCRSAVIQQIWSQCLLGHKPFSPRRDGRAASGLAGFA